MVFKNRFRGSTAPFIFAANEEKVHLSFFTSEKLNPQFFFKFSHSFSSFLNEIQIF